MSRARKVAINLSAILLSDFIVKSLGVVSVGTLTRRIGPENFGLLNFCLVAVNYFILAATWGLPAVGVRDISVHPHHARPLTWHITRVRLWLGLGMFVIFSVWAHLVFGQRQAYSVLHLYMLSLWTTIAMIEWPFQGLERLVSVSTVRILAGLVYLGGILLLVRGPQDFRTVPILLTLSQAVSAILLITLFLRTAPASPENPTLPSAMELLRSSASIGLSAFLTTALLNADTLLIGAFRTKAEIGYYSAGYRILTLFSGVIADLANVIYPTFAHYAAHAQDRLALLLRYLGRILVTLLVPAMIGGLFTAGPLMHLFYGSTFAPGATALQILFVSLWMNSVNSLYFFILVSERKQHLLWKILGVQVAVNIGLNLALIPRYGILGAAAATVASDVVGYLLYSRLTHWPIVFWRPLRRILPACLLMSAVLAFGRWQYWSAFWLIGVALPTYGVALLATGGVTREDLRFGLALLKRKEAPVPQ